MLVFAFAPAVGVLIAVILEVFQEGESFDEFPFQILQGEFIKNFNGFKFF